MLDINTNHGNANQTNPQGDTTSHPRGGWPSPRRQIVTSASEEVGKSEASYTPVGM